MVGKILSITNQCIDNTILFDCTDYFVTSFQWRDIERRNTQYNYDSKNGGFSTCMRDNIRKIELKIFMAEDDKIQRGKLRKRLEKVFTNYDCCGTCCPLLIVFEDDDGQIYSFEAKLGNADLNDSVGGHKVALEYTFSLEMCGGVFQNNDLIECCGTLGSIGGFRFPFCNCLSSCISGSKFMHYDGNVCGDFIVEIDGKVDNLRFWNLTKNTYYGVNTFSGKMTINTDDGAFINNQIVLASNRAKGSTLTGIKMSPGLNEFILTGTGDANFCIKFSNDIA